MPCLLLCPSSSRPCSSAFPGIGASRVSSDFGRLGGPGCALGVGTLLNAKRGARGCYQRPAQQPTQGIVQLGGKSFQCGNRQAGAAKSGRRQFARVRGAGLGGGEKEKGRLLAPFLQFRKETAAERSARCYPEEAGCDKPCAVTAVFVALPRQA